MSTKDIIRTENSTDSLARYEELLLRRDSLRKKAEQYQISYFREFGDLMVESFSVRIECIKRKKMVAYCQAQVNQGKTISGAQLDHYIEREMLDYQDDLDNMIKHNQAVRKSGYISEYDRYRIKKIYHDLAKLIHPDLHPGLAGDSVISEFWQRIVVAYEHNQLDDMEDLEFQVKLYLKGKGENKTDIVIPDLAKKISRVEEEIDQIINTEPYLYRLLLDDRDAVEAKREKLREEIKTYTEYSKQLDEVLAGFSIERSYS